MVPVGQVSPTHLFRSFEEADEFLRVLAKVTPGARFDYWIAVGEREEWPGSLTAGDVIAAGGMVAFLEREFKDIVASHENLITPEWKQQATRALETLRKLRAPLPRPGRVQKMGFFRRLTRNINLSFLGL